MQSVSRLQKTLEFYSPTNQTSFANNPDWCVCNRNQPSLTQMHITFGEKITTEWLIMQLNDYNNYVGVKEEAKSTRAQMEQIAELIYSEYKYLKLSEIMLFFHRLKCGKYGGTYGAVNGVDIMRALNSFRHDRADIIERYESAEREREWQIHIERCKKSINNKDVENIASRLADKLKIQK